MKNLQKKRKRTCVPVIQSDRVEAKEKDEVILRNLIHTICKGTPVKYIFRLREKAPKNTRPNNITLKSAENKEKIFGNLSKIKSIDKSEVKRFRSSKWRIVTVTHVSVRRD